MIKNEFPVNVGSIVQAHPSLETFGACLVTVAELKPWGIQGYVQSAGVKGQQYVRLTWAQMEPTGGRAVWVAGGAGDECGEAEAGA